MQKLVLLILFIFSLTLVACGGGGSSSPSDSTKNDVIDGNTVPAADAGADQNVTTASSVQLDASSSHDEDEGDLLTYRWELTSIPTGSSATLSDAEIVNPTFTPDLDGEYRLELIVDDGKNSSDPDSVLITASTDNSAPVADAGPDRDVFTSDNVTLDGSGSSDADGDQLTYDWMFVTAPSGSSASLSDSTEVSPTFTADLDGAYEISLVVNDGTASSAEDTVIIDATVSNTVPVADAGIDQNVTVGDVVNLDGSGSSDADGDSLTYSWTFQSLPTGSTATLSENDAVNPTFTADLDGSYVLNLTVNDGLVSSQTDSLLVEAQAPALEIGTPYTAADGLTVTINSIVVTEKIGSFTYAVDYTLENQTMDVIDEGTFKLYFNDNTGLPQYGFFDKLFPGDSTHRSYVFEEVKSKVPTVLGYHHDHFFSDTPPAGSLLWEIVMP